MAVPGIARALVNIAVNISVLSIEDKRTTITTTDVASAMWSLATVAYNIRPRNGTVVDEERTQGRRWLSKISNFFLLFDYITSAPSANKKCFNQPEGDRSVLSLPLLQTCCVGRCTEAQTAAAVVVLAYLFSNSMEFQTTFRLGSSQATIANQGTNERRQAAKKPRQLSNSKDITAPRASSTTCKLLNSEAITVATMNTKKNQTKGKGIDFCMTMQN